MDQRITPNQFQSYEIKEVGESDFQAIANLWALAFNIPGAEPINGDLGLRKLIEDYCRQGLSYIVGAYYNDTLIAVSGVIDFEMHIANRWLPCGGIAGVATYPEHRRRNLVRLLLTKCLEHLYARKVPLSALWPFSYPFYERLGWAVSDIRHSVELDLSALRNFGDGRAYLRVNPDVDSPDFARAMELHERWSGQLNLSLRRGKYRWHKMFHDPRFRRHLFVHDEGYMIWDLNESQERTLRLNEWCHLSDDAFIDGLALLGQMDSQFQKATLPCQDYQPFLQRLGTRGVPSVLVKPGMMSRVVHLESFLAPLDLDLSTFLVKDPLCITGPAEVAGESIGPGELVQHVTGLWKEPPHGWPRFLRNVFAQHPAFSVEQY
jgi:predicted acetyltransferase